jgi:lipoate-protein ligase A
MSKSAWRYIDEDQVSAAYGLASDEYLMQSHTAANNAFPATLKLYTYRDHCALCGRFQDLRAEIDLDACRALDVEFGRRLTGGGAILMGRDQLGICFSTNSSSFRWNHIRELYQLFSEPIIAALASFGISARFRSKNDLESGGKKIAGLGIHISAEGGIQFHASVLLDLDIPRMLHVLKIPAQKISDKKMVHSIEGRMTTICRESPSEVSMPQLKQSILEAFQRAFAHDVTNLPFSSVEKNAISVLVNERYSSDEWLYLNTPQQDMDGMSLKKTSAGLLRTYIAMKGENIKSVLITGDFLDLPPVFARIESQLKWTPLDRERVNISVKNAYATRPSSEPPVNILPEEVADAIWMAAQRTFAAHKYTYTGSCYYPKENVDS